MFVLLKTLTRNEMILMIASVIFLRLIYSMETFRAPVVKLFLYCRPDCRMETNRGRMVAAYRKR